MNEESDKIAKPSSNSAFPTTRWTWVRQVQQEEEVSEMALNLLCGVYWYPLFVTSRRKHGLNHHQAEDATQGFWEWFIAKDYLSRAQPERGKFRNFLVTYFDNFLLHEWRADRAQKRGGGAVVISRDSDQWNERCENEMGLYTSPEEHLDRVWERANIEASFKEVESDWTRKGKAAVFGALKAHILDGAEHGGASAIARNLGLSEKNVRQQISRLRKDLRASYERWVGEPSPA